MPARVQLSEASIAAVQSPRRVELLVLLEESTWTSAELALETGIDRTTVSHHLRALIGAGLAHEVGSTPIAGGPLRSYGAVHRGWAAAFEALNAVSQG